MRHDAQIATKNLAILAIVASALSGCGSSADDDATNRTSRAAAPGERRSSH
ncbi:MAG: hypothetical protein JW940_34970 [Polyangiaceae bacterium]|nr:hypothetical protein [Polyangiaceae bacterium]